MKKPTDKKIKAMSTTLKGAKEAAVLKWEWLCQASLRSVRGMKWPICGFCVFFKYHKRTEECWELGCPLWFCYAGSLFDEAADIAEYGTLAEFRIAANKMLDKIKSVEIKEK